MVTAKELRALAARARRQAERWRENAEASDRQAAELEKMADEAAKNILSPTDASSSMFGSKMELQNDRVNKRVKIAATMTEEATEAKRALLEAGLTPQDVATKRKVGRSTVDAWCRGTRSIPRADRDWLKEKFGIPLRVWKKQAE